MAAKGQQDGQLRVMLWSNPRTLSTVFLKCMSYVEGTQAINEPYAVARVAGPDRPIPALSTLLLSVSLQNYKQEYAAKLASVKPDLPKGWDDDDCTYQWVKETLEAPYSDYKMVFCKDQAFGVHGRFNMLPKGYRHTFLIRNPYKLYPSWRKVWLNMMPPQMGMDQLPDILMPSKLGLGELYDLVQHVKENMDQNPIIIDADDLQTNPASIMRQYCEAIGVPFQESMLSWEAGDAITDDWIASRNFIRGNKLEGGGGYYDELRPLHLNFMYNCLSDEALESTGFHPSKPPRDRDQLTEDVLNCIDRVMPVYTKMYEMRLRP